MYERFTDRARKVMQLACQEAQRFNHEYIGTEHILLGLMKEGAGVAAHVLKNLDLDLHKLRLEVEKIVQSGPEMVTMGKLPQTPWAKKVIEYAIDEARDLNHNYVGTEHLLLGLVRAQDSVAGQILMNLRLNLHDVREDVLELLGHPRSAKRSDSDGVQKAPLLTAAEEGIRWLEKKIQNDRERIGSLERQLWSLRVLLGAAAGAIASALIWKDKGLVVEGLILGGIIAGLGGRILGVLAGGITGASLASVHLGSDGGGLAGALLGALAGFLIAEIGGTTGSRGFLGNWRKR
jgi:hypothetical protein